MAATITVHEPDGEGRVFVDVIGKIDDGDFETFKEKTDQIYPIRAPKKQVIVTLISDGGLIGPAMQIGELVLNGDTQSAAGNGCGALHTVEANCKHDFIGASVIVEAARRNPV
jgi:hypothetical protein